MTFVIGELIFILVLLFAIIGLTFFCVVKVKGFLREYFGTSSLKDAIEKSRITDSETQRTVYGNESIYLDRIARDFPDLNINELKSSAEANIRSILHAIETKNTDDLKNKNDRIYAYAVNKIEDLKKDTVSIDSIKFHKTVLNKYHKDNNKCTMNFQTSMEYFYKKNKDIGRKVQMRFDTEFIHIIDTSAYGPKVRTLGINCPNCGAPVKDIDNPHCEYCTSGLVVPASGVELVKRVWFLDNIKEVR